MVTIQQWQRKTERTEFIDGVRDFHTALHWLMPGLIFWIGFDLSGVWSPIVNDLKQLMGDGIATIVILFVTFVVPLLISFGVMRWMNEVLRRRWLWRESGLIKPKSWVVPRAFILGSLALSMGIFLIGGLLAIQTQDLRWFFWGLLIGCGWSQSVFFIILGRRLQLPRYQVLAVIGAVASPFILLLPLTTGLMGFVFSLFWALLFITSGILGVRETVQMQRIAADGT